MLANTQALFETCEHVLAREGLHSARVQVPNATTNLVLPFRTELESVEAGCDGFEQVCALARWKLKRVLENSLRFSHADNLADCVGGRQYPAHIDGQRRFDAWNPADARIREASDVNVRARRR